MAIFNQQQPTISCKSSAGSDPHDLLRLGLFKEENTARIVILPAASITAKSEPVGLQERCFKGPPSKAEEKLGVTVGSLRAQVPFSGWQRRFRSSKAAPFEAIAAMLPHFDQAIPLSRVKNRGKDKVWMELTGNSRLLLARLIFGIALSRGASKVETGQSHHRKDPPYYPCPSRPPSALASFSK